jgi:ATP-binding cassette, subfamily C, bacterial
MARVRRAQKRAAYLTNKERIGFILGLETAACPYATTALCVANHVCSRAETQKMSHIFRIFFRAEGTRSWLVLACLVLGGIFQAFGIGSILPIATRVLGNEGGSPSLVEEILVGIVRGIGLEPGLGSLLFVIAAIFTLRSVLLFAAMSYASIASTYVSLNLRRRLIRSIFAARWSFYGEQSTGNLANAVSNDAANAGTAYRLSSEALAYGLQVLAYSLIALAINWRVALFGILGGAIITLASKNLIRFARRSGLKNRDRVAMLTADMVDMFQNFKPLKTMHRYDAQISGLARHLKKMRKSLASIYLAQHGVSYGTDAMVAIIGATGAYFAFKNGGVPLAELAVMAVLFFQVTTFIGKFLKYVQQAAALEASHLRLTELIAQAEQAEEMIPGKLSPSIGKGKGCSFRNVTFSHGKTTTVQNVSLEIPSGSVTVLQGPSGAGKTTIIDLLIGLNRPSAGSILIGDTPIEQVDLRQWRKKIGYVPQELVLLHDTIRENLVLGDEAISDASVTEALRQADALDFVMSLPDGVQTDVGEFGSKLSGGQRQRISLARALVAKPELLILDEVTSALDPATEVEIVKRVSTLTGRYTIIAITHRPLWTEIADKLYEVRDGTVTEINHRELQRALT